jgi:cysteinyl-tRNA synthetase
MAGEINSFLTNKNVESGKNPADVQAALAATQTLRALGQQVLGIFTAAKPQAAGEEAALLEKVMGLMIQLRADARKQKNFALADAIRKGLDEIGLMLEDRPDGTIWRRK